MIKRHNVLKLPESRQRGGGFNELDELISDKPELIVRWGNVFFLIMLVVFGILGYLIKYPEKIITTAKIVSIESPKPIISQVSAQLDSLFCEEGQSVQTGTEIGYLEAFADHADVKAIKGKLKLILNNIENNEKINLSDLLLSSRSIGELQSKYQAFYESGVNYLEYQSDGIYTRKIENLENEFRTLAQVKMNLEEEKKLKIEELRISRELFSMNKVLNDSNVISKKDFKNEKLRYLSQKSVIPQINTAILNNEQQQSQKLREAMDIRNNASKAQANFKNACLSFQNEINNWEKNYVLKAPIDGKLVFATIVQQKQEVNAGEVICWVNPYSESYYGELHIPQRNFGRVKLKQKVHFKLHSYPHSQYGMLVGKISFVSKIPTSEGYLAKVEIDSLITTHGIKLYYREGLLSEVEIITDDLRLIDRYLYRFKDILPFY